MVCDAAEVEHHANLEWNARHHGRHPAPRSFLGTSAQFWLNLQSLYDLRLAQEKVGKSIKALPTLKRRELVHAWRVNARNSGNDGPRPENWQAARSPFPNQHPMLSTYAPC